MDICWVPRSTIQYRIIADNFNPIFSEREYLEDEHIYCLEVTVEDDLAAVSMVKHSHLDGRLTLLYTFVLPPFRKQGINTQIKKSIEVLAKEKGADHLLGHVRGNNVASLNSLLKSGYQVIDEGGKFYKNGDKKLTVKKILS